MRLSSSDALPSIAACRHTEPEKLGRLLRGDLDWIVLKPWKKIATAATTRRTAWRATFSGIWPTSRSQPARRPALPFPKNGPPEQAGLRRRQSALAATLLIGTLVSTFFAVQASRRADDNLALAKEEASARAESEKQQKLAETNATLAKQRQHESDENAKTVRRHLYFANMNLAQLAWEDNHLAEVLDLLKRTTPKPGEDDLADLNGTTGIECATPT